MKKLIIALPWIAAALLAGACAGPPQLTAEDQERLNREYRTGSNFPKRREAGVETVNKDVLERAQQVGPPGPAMSGAR